MTTHRRDHVVATDELLARIRACIAQSPAEAVISVTVNIGRNAETKRQQCSASACSRTVELSMSAEEPWPSSSQPITMAIGEQRPSAQPSPPLPPETRPDMNVDDQEPPVVSSDGMDDESPDDGDAVPRVTRTQRAVLQDDNKASLITEPSSRADNIRRSARQQHPPDSLLYLADVSSHSAVQRPEPRVVKRADSSTAGPRGSGSKRSSKVPADVHHAEESTDTEAVEDNDLSSSSADSSSSSRSRSTGSKKQKHDAPRTSSYTDEAEQVAALVMKLKESYSRQGNAPDMESASKEAVLQLGRDVLADVECCILKIDHLISTSTAMRMLGYYLRGALAARLKRSHNKKYVRSARLLLGLKSSARTSRRAPPSTRLSSNTVPASHPAQEA
jgi:hypothetical protein